MQRFLALHPILPASLALLLFAPRAHAQYGWWVEDEAAYDDAFGTAIAAGDFDGDGTADLAVGIPRQDLETGAGTHVDAGAVRVYLNGPGGASAGEIYWHKGAAGSPDAPASYDRTGTSLAAGDFDGDGFDDLAVGSPGDDFSGAPGAGSILVLRGGAGGLSAQGVKRLHQDVPGAAGGCESYDGFGGSLVAGDFDGDGCDDLAVGIPLENIGGETDAGAVQVFRGGFGTGLTAAQDQLWYQDASGVEGASLAGDRFGFALAAGDFDADGSVDLAVGVPGKDPGKVAGAPGNDGAVHVLYAAPGGGLSAQGQDVWDPFTAQGLDLASGSFPSAPFALARSSQFGYALAAGDFDADGVVDLAAGAPYAGVSSGAVFVMRGSASSGVQAGGTEIWSQDSPGIAGVAEPGDLFGGSLAAGRFDFVPGDELVVGVPFEAYGESYAGVLHVLYSSGGSQMWHQDVSGVEGSTGYLDTYARSLAAGDFNGDGLDDLAAGIPGENVDEYAYAGAVSILFAYDESGLAAAGDVLIHETVWLGYDPPIYGW